MCANTAQTAALHSGGETIRRTYVNKKLQAKTKKFFKKGFALGHFFGMYSEGFFIASRFFEKHRTKRVAQVEIEKILNIL
jgi:regulator of replication initiation timing